MAESDITQVRNGHFPDFNVEVGTIEGPASYAAGGFAAQAVAAAGQGFGLSVVDFVSIEPVIAGATTCLVAKYNHATWKIQGFEAEAVDLPFTEVTDVDDLSTFEFRFFAVGKL